MTVKNTIDGMPLWLLAKPEHSSNLLDARQPFLLVNQYDSQNACSLAPTHELSQVTFSPKIIRDFCNHETMAIPIKKSYRNPSNLVVLGRSEGVDIIITRKEVSKSHCGFYKVNGDWHVTDLDSTNGIAINGQKTPKGKLSSQSVISIGGTIEMAFITAIDLAFLAAEISAF
jgi:hypothetical protein